MDLWLLALTENCQEFGSPAMNQPGPSLRPAQDVVRRCSLAFACECISLADAAPWTPIGHTVTGVLSSAPGRFSLLSRSSPQFRVTVRTERHRSRRQAPLPLFASLESLRSRIHAVGSTLSLSLFWKMIICKSKMEYTLKSQSQRVQKQVKPTLTLEIYD